MTHSAHPFPLQASSSGPLAGKVRVPGDKSISHRALILGALSVGETRISGLLEGEDVLNTAKAMRALGAKVERTGEFAWSVRGVGVGGFAQPPVPLDFGNSGTGCRLVMGAVAGCPITAVFDGDASLRTQADAAGARPARIDGRAGRRERQGGRLPLTLNGARDPLPILYRTPVASAQIKSAVLLAGLAAPGATTVIETEASRDHTELMLTHFGAQILSTPRRAPWPQDHPYRTARTAWRRRGGSGRPVIGGVPDRGRPDRRGIRYRAVRRDDQPAPDRADRRRCAKWAPASKKAKGGATPASAMAQFRVRASKLHGVEVPPERAPSMIDEYLVLAVAAAFAEGTTIMRGLQELRVKESDRLEATAAMLRVNGVKVEVAGNDMIVEGRGHVPGGGLVATHMDHRIAMSALVMGLASDQPVKVDDTASSPPAFRISSR